MNHSTPGLLVQHQLPELTQTHVHWISDAIQPSHPLLSPSPVALNLSQHQGLFQSQLFLSGGQNIGASASASVLPVNIQGWFPLGLTGLISLLSKRLFSSTTIWKYQFFRAQPSLWSNSHIHTWPPEKPQLWLYRPYYLEYKLIKSYLEISFISCIKIMLILIFIELGKQPQ